MPTNLQPLVIMAQASLDLLAARMDDADNGEPLPRLLVANTARAVGELALALAERLEEQPE